MSRADGRWNLASSSSGSGAIEGNQIGSLQTPVPHASTDLYSTTYPTFLFVENDVVARIATFCTTSLDLMLSLCIVALVFHIKMRFVSIGTSLLLEHVSLVQRITYLGHQGGLPVIALLHAVRVISR